MEAAGKLSLMRSVVTVDGLCSNLPFPAAPNLHRADMTATAQGPAAILRSLTIAMATMILAQNVHSLWKSRVCVERRRFEINLAFFPRCGVAKYVGESYDVVLISAANNATVRASVRTRASHALSHVVRLRRRVAIHAKNLVMPQARVRRTNPANTS